MFIAVECILWATEHSSSHCSHRQVYFTKKFFFILFNLKPFSALNFEGLLTISIILYALSLNICRCEMFSLFSNSTYSHHIINDKIRMFHAPSTAILFVKENFLLLSTDIVKAFEPLRFSLPTPFIWTTTHIVPSAHCS